MPDGQLLSDADPKTTTTNAPLSYSALTKMASRVNINSSARAYVS